MSEKEEVNHPTRYNAGSVECIDAIESALTPEEYRGFIKGTVLRYVWREKHKGQDQDLQKAEWYTRRLLDYEKKRSDSQRVKFDMDFTAPAKYTQEKKQWRCEAMLDKMADTAYTEIIDGCGRITADDKETVDKIKARIAVAKKMEDRDLKVARAVRDAYDEARRNGMGLGDANLIAIMRTI